MTEPGASIVPGDSAIRYDSKPDLAGGWLNSGWDCDQWMTWHKRLMEHHKDAEKVKEIFLKEWNAQGGWDWDYINCKYRSDFQDYFKQHGIGVPAVVKVVTSAGDIATSAADSAEQIAEKGIGGFGDSLGTVLKWLPWIALVAAALIAFFYFKSLTKVVA